MIKHKVNRMKEGLEKSYWYLFIKLMSVCKTWRFLLHIFYTKIPVCCKRDLFKSWNGFISINYLNTIIISSFTGKLERNPKNIMKSKNCTTCKWHNSKVF